MSNQDGLSFRESNYSRDRFSQLLIGFKERASRDVGLSASATARIRTVLDQFCERLDRVDVSEKKSAADSHSRIGSLLLGFGNALERYRQHQEQLADDFNVLDVLRLTGNEVRHGMVLAWLLDHDMFKLGTHAQGSLGFRLFLCEFGLPIDWAASKYWVTRESIGDESIVDIEIACRERFIIHIENKIWSGEGRDQTDREWSDLQRRAIELNVDMSNVRALFLTPRGAKPMNPNFVGIAWGRVVRVLERFAEKAIPSDVRIFTAHYAWALRQFIVVQDRNEDIDAQRTDERG